MTDVQKTEYLPDVEVQQAPTIAFLGPKGNFTHIAALELKRQPNHEKARLLDNSSIDNMFDSVTIGTAKYALVPVENSTDGAVRDTHDNLYKREGVQILGEFVLPISQTLYYQDINQVEIIASKKEAIGQCKEHINARFGKDITIKKMDSTGTAVAEAAKNPKIAALGSAISADAQGLAGILQKEDNFNDRESNATTFALVGLSGELPPPTGNDKTTFTMTMPDTHGLLVHALDVLAQNNVDLNKIKSIGKHDGKVTFLVSADGHLQDGVTGKALTVLENDEDKDIIVKRLGSYAKAEYAPPETEETYDFEAAIERINIEAGNGEAMDENKSIAIFTLKDHPGALRDALRPFADRKINLTKIDSQPSGIHNEHIFYVAFDKTTENQEELLRELRNQSHFHKVIPGGGTRE